MIEVVPGIYTFTGLVMGRVYVFTEGDGLTIVDACMPGSAPKIIAQLAEASYTPDQVKRVLITHAHPDHVGGLAELVEATGAEVVSSSTEKPYIEGAEGMPRASGKSSPTGTAIPVDRTVADGEVIEEVEGGLQVVYTPGHSPGHTSFWLPAQKLLVAGDVTMNFFNRGPMPPFAAFTTDMDENRRSLQKVAALNPEVIAFGHGPPLNEDAAQKLHQFAQKQAAKLNRE